MLIRNGELINLDKTDDPLVIEMMNTLKNEYGIYKFEDKKTKKKIWAGLPVKLTWNKSVRRYDEENKKYKYPSGVAIKLRARKSNKNGTTDDWIYCETISGTKENRKFAPEYINFTMNKTFFEGQIDLIYFILELSGQIKKDAEGNYISKIVKEDKAKEAKNYVKNEQIKIDIKRQIFATDSVLKENEIRLLATSWGVKNAFTADYDIVRMELEQAVIRREKSHSDGFRKFMDDTNLGDRIEIRAKLRQAEDESFIIFEQTDSSWYNMNDGKKENRICIAKSYDSKHDDITDFFLKNKQEFEVLVDKLK